MLRINTMSRQHGLEPEGFDAKDVSRQFAPTTYSREFLARVQAVMDFLVLDK